MAMRVCMYCHEQISYERENRNLLAKGGAVGFWTNPITQQASCPMAPVDGNGQQLHNPGDVHTPPVEDPAEIEKFLDGSYIPKPPKAPCGQMYGLADDGEFLMCGLEEGHLDGCAPGTAVDTQAQAAAQAAQNSANPTGGPMMVNLDIQQDPATGKYTVSADANGMEMSLTFDPAVNDPAETMSFLSGFPDAAARLIMEQVMGVDMGIVDAINDAGKQAAKPEKPKAPDLDDVADVEKFLRGED